MASMKEMLKEDLAKSLKEFGPDSPSVKALKQQLASMETYRMPSDLAVMKSGQTDKYHGSVLKSNAPAQDPMLPARNGLEAALRKSLEKANPGMRVDPHTVELVPIESKS